MTAETILFICIAGVISFALALFMYGYKTKYSNTLRWIFGALRFITLFSILLLIINPKFESRSYTIEKPKLSVLIDNSESVSELNQTENVSAFLQQIKKNKDLNDKFDLSFFSFGNDFKMNDSLTFSEKNTNISKALTSVNELFKNETAPTIVVTDGNQTLGSDYEYLAPSKNKIFPVILGDSITYTDLKIQQLNTNRYAFLKNQFPVEVILAYDGKGTANSQFLITQGNATVFKQNVSFSEIDNSKTISFTLPASSVGLQKYTAQIVPLNDEKNTVNNSKQFAVEVIDQATNVLVVSSIIHPDLGALKKTIISNEQRKFLLKTPSEAVQLLNDHQLIILYQPNRSFAGVFSEINKLKKNTLIITGLQTDWRFLNSMQDSFKKNATSQTESVSAELNANYGSFVIGDIGFNNFPPLSTLFGELEIQAQNEIILSQSINGFSIQSALLATMEVNGKRDAIWDGEGFWRWRAQSFLQNNSFEDFDNFTGKLIQYLASSKRRSRLEVSNETFYYNNNSIRISAQYFDENFVFDPRASLTIQFTNTENEQQTVFPMLLKNNFYEVDLNSLPAGEYQFTVSVKGEAISRSGSFTILDFNVEQQFLNANVTKLNSLATNTNGKSYFINQSSALFSQLLEDDSFQPIQKSEIKVVPLIDWKYLLALIILSLTAEWFIRKFNGLI